MSNADGIVRAAKETIEHLQGCYEVMSALAEVRKEEIESLQADLAHMTAERDAAVEYTPLECGTCAHWITDEVCAVGSKDNCFWKWRGVKGELNA